MSNLVIALPISEAQIHQLTALAEFEDADLHEMLRILISRGYVNHKHALSEVMEEFDKSSDPDPNAIYTINIPTGGDPEEELDDEIPF